MKHLKSLTGYNLLDNIIKMPKVEKERIEGIFKDYPYIAAAYLFGSAARDKAGPMSDIDIAILLKEPFLKGKELIHEEDYLSYRIAKVLYVKEVDIININKQGFVFQHNILQTSRLIYDTDSAFRVKFEMQVISNFCDFEPTIRFMEKFYTQGRANRLARL